MHQRNEKAIEFASTYFIGIISYGTVQDTAKVSRVSEWQRFIASAQKRQVEKDPVIDPIIQQRTSFVKFKANTQHFLEILKLRVPFADDDGVTCDATTIINGSD